ncbi:nuclear pore complex protein Nup98-Nup96 isoform X2 [Venturia canescens]|uniref:nuclear pore complex protein Nup98-Nup96 isoform X2 n=1 Tax=Venturia canescens TaxID=32260 RepID=UPI001C9C1AD8|nr:nuclear pore complex protein Nup98-Nup96 isoform X2 [Venturia canescens]
MFGQAGNTSFGGFNTATQSSPFGQSAFGKPISTTSFGTGATPVFGSNNTSLFSAKPAGATTNSLFGNTAAAPAFGQPATTQSSFGAFGGTGANTSLFGTQQNANTNLFGTSATTSAFGQANKPAGFGFGAPASNNLFGQPQSGLQQATPFGQTSTAANTSLFGNTGGITGTMVKFNPLTGTDTMVKNGVTQNISTRHQCIMCMKEYESKSLEELRLEDYTAGLKGPAQTGQTTGLFGATAQQSPFGNTGAITSTGTSGFGSIGSGFGASTQTAATGSLFGKPVTGFGAPTTTTSAFAFNPATTSNLFGVNTQTKPFGTAAPTTLFSNTGTAQSATTGFGVMNGAQNSSFGSFGTTQPTQSIGLFNQNKSAFNIPTSNSGFGAFGQTAAANTGTSVFGPKPLGTTGFGAPTFGTGTAPSFGNTTAFGNTQNTNTSLFNSTLKPPGQNTGFSFGATPVSSSGLGTNTGLTLGVGGSLFGQSKPGGLFSSGTTGTTFNTGSTFNSTPGFGTNTGLGNTSLGMNLLGSGMGTNPNQQNSSSVAVHQQILALVSAPFGDSPLLKNLLPASGKAEELLKPANPVSRTLNSPQYKVTTNNNSPKVKPRVVTGVSLSKKSLFEGLEEEDPTLLEAFQPRPNTKRLVLRPKAPSSAQTNSVEQLNSSRNNGNREESVDATSSCGNDPRDETVDVGSPSTTQDTETSTTKNVQKPNLRGKNERTSSDSWLRRRQVTGFEENRASLDNTDIAEEALEYTLEEFRAHRNNPTASSNNESPSANVSLSSMGADKSAGDSPGVFNDTTHDLEESLLSIVQQDWEPNKSKVILRRVGYYTRPPYEKLEDYVHGETCVVPNFTIGRKGYGNVYFPDSFDIYGLNLDEIVHFRHKEVIIYPDDEKKPPVGQGLNRRAQVTLEHVWPHDKSLHEPITDPYRLTTMNYEEKLRRVSAKHDTRFLEYRPETGSWVFKVDHFSKYGLSDSDDDDNDVPLDPGMKKLKGIVKWDKELSTSRTVVTGATNGTPRNLDKTGSLNHEDESDLDRTLPVKDFSGEKQHSALSPTSIHARIMGTDSHKLQLMKASFFDHEDENDEPMYEGTQQPSFKNHFKAYDIMDEDQPALQSYFPTLRSNLTLHNQLPFASPTDSVYDTKEIKMKQPVEVKSEKFTKLVKAFPPPIVKPTTVVLKFRGEVIPLHRSICSRLKFQSIADIGIQMGRTFRPSWGPGLTLVSLSSQEQAAVVPLHNTFSQIETYVSGRLMDDTTSMSIVQRLQILGGAGADSDHVEMFRDSIEDHLRIQLNHCIMGQEGDCPVIEAPTGESALAALHAHCAQAEKLANYVAPDRLAFYSRDVWRLCIALWGNLPELQPDADKERHDAVIVRREAFGDWLKTVVEENVQREIAEISEDDRLIFSLLTANKLEEACEQAAKTGDYTLALLISQLGGAAAVKELLKQTIALWQATDIVADFSMCRLKLYMLVASEQLISCREDVVNACENLDWKRALAVHLWYLASPTASITDVLDLYVASFSGAPTDIYAAAPLPDYKDEDYDAEISSGKQTYDLCYHLLKLYSTGDHQLEELLNPLTHTADPLDYRLSWLMLQMIVGLGYKHLSEHVAALTHTNFASQLEAYDLWHWAIFVVLHLRDSGIRRKAVLDLLSRHVEIDDDPEYVKREEFLKEELGISSMWINEAKAVKGCAMQRYGEAAWYLIQAELWNKAHEVIIEHLAADAVINENYEYLRSLLSPLVPTECNTLVNGWAYQGQLLWDYMEIAVEIETFLKNRDFAEIGYKLELLQPQLTSLCTKINHFPCPTAKLRLCQAEIAKRTLHLARSLLLLQPNENRSTARVLVHLVSQLPLPEDYAQQELRPIINMCVNEVLSH